MIWTGGMGRIGAGRRALGLCLLAFASCGGPGARAPSPAHVALPASFATAFRLEELGSANDAVRAHLDVVRSAAEADTDPWQVPALQASLDALATRTVVGLGPASRDAALAYRTRDGEAIASELARVAARAKGPFAGGLIARVLATMAERRGDATEAELFRQESGCVREALVVAPTSLSPLTGVREPGLLGGADSRIEPAYPSVGPFDSPIRPLAVRAHDCAIDLSAQTTRPGVRDVVVDVTVASAQTIGLVLRAHGAATLRAAGTLVIDRPFELGDGEAAQRVRVDVTAGVLRLVARVGTAKEDDAVEIDAFGADGKSLPARTPAIGAPSTARVRSIPAALALTDLGRDADETLLLAASALASGDPTGAERCLWADATQADAHAELALAYGRAVESARDLSPATRAERARAAYERVLEVWPGSWEAAVAHAVLAGVRRGHDEAGIESLRDLEASRAKAALAQVSLGPVVDAFEASVSGREQLFDRAFAALGRARDAIGDTALWTDAREATSPRVGAELVAARCADGPAQRAAGRDTLACFEALGQAGDRAGQARELERLRALLGAPTSFLGIELSQALASGDDATARRAFSAMQPGRRTMTAVAMLGTAGDDASKLLAAAATAPDAPGSIAPLLRAAGRDDTAEEDDIADRIAAEDRVHPIMPSAATAVLAHNERYEVSASGLVHWVLFDVRRVSGTTDVEENAQAAAPDVWGRGSMRALRRRILKHDGRTIEPDRTPRASQAHADLSQLEQGDIVEALYEGYALPGDAGDVGIDTPDLLPDRTAVHDATIELTLPATLRGSLFSHPLLGAAVERKSETARILTWHVADRAARLLEDGVPKMDRSVGVSFSTAEWTGIARALRETVAALDEHDPEIAAWARAAVAEAGKSPRAKLDALVSAAGKALREANADTLSDFGGGAPPVQSQTARTFLSSHEGSRAWLIWRSLRELAIPCDLVVAENEPYSADPAFPPHFGRFVHPLLVAHVPAASGTDDVWIDADVAGPPLPAGRISPELRGRLSLHTDGSIVPLPALGTPQDERDEIDVRLSLDEKGNARGLFAILLRGRDAQQLSEAFVRIVGSERQRALRGVVLAWLPGANVDDVQLASTEGSWQVSLRAEVSVSGYAQAEAGTTFLLPGLDALHWAWPRAHVGSLSSAFATRAGRESALALSSAVQYHVHRRVELAKGAIIGRMPGPMDVKGKLVEASRRMVVAPDAIVDDFELGVSTGTIPAAEYGRFVAAARAADDGFLATTRLSWPAPKAEKP